MTDIYVGDDGKLHKVQGGADSVLPFSNDPSNCQLLYSHYGTKYSDESSWRFSKTVSIEKDGIVILSSASGTTFKYSPSVSITLNGNTKNANIIAKSNPQLVAIFSVKKGDSLYFNITQSPAINSTSLSMPSIGVILYLLY